MDLHAEEQYILALECHLAPFYFRHLTLLGLAGLAEAMTPNRDNLMSRDNTCRHYHGLYVSLDCFQPTIIKIAYILHENLRLHVLILTSYDVLFVNDADHGASPI
jgi:hypothetical protein